MKKTDWIDVIGKIDPAYVKEAEQWSKAAQKKRNLKHFTAMAEQRYRRRDRKCCRRRDERRCISPK